MDMPRDWGLNGDLNQGCTLNRQKQILSLVFDDLSLKVLAGGTSGCANSKMDLVRAASRDQTAKPPLVRAASREQTAMTSYRRANAHCGLARCNRFLILKVGLKEAGFPLKNVMHF